jgi:hypothetical protein
MGLRKVVDIIYLPSFNKSLCSEDMVKFTNHPLRQLDRIFIIGSYWLKINGHTLCGTNY